MGITAEELLEEFSLHPSATFNGTTEPGVRGHIAQESAASRRGLAELEGSVRDGGGDGRPPRIARRTGPGADERVWRRGDHVFRRGVVD